MTRETRARFASMVWREERIWRDERMPARPAIAKAILTLSNDKRSPEAILRAPTAQEWRHVVHILAEPDDDAAPELTGERLAWGLLWGLSQETRRLWRTDRAGDKEPRRIRKKASRQD